MGKMYREPLQFFEGCESKKRDGRKKNEAESPQTTGNSTLVPPRRIERYRQNRNPVILPKIQSDMRRENYTQAGGRASVS